MSTNTAIKMVKLPSSPPDGSIETALEQNNFTVFKMQDHTLPVTTENFTRLKDCAMIQHRTPSGKVEQYFAFIVIVDNKPGRAEQVGAANIEVVTDKETADSVNFNLGGASYNLSLDDDNNPIIAPNMPNDPEGDNEDV